MRTEALIFASVLVAGSGVASAQAPAAGDKAVLDGKAIFTSQKCDMCHAVASADVKATSKIKAPDLSTVALQDATAMGKYLRKQAPLKGKPHVKAFTGSDEQLGALIAWLQKHAKPAAGK